MRPGQNAMYIRGKFWTLELENNGYQISMCFAGRTVDEAIALFRATQKYGKYNGFDIVSVRVATESDQQSFRTIS